MNAVMMHYPADQERVATFERVRAAYNGHVDVLVDYLGVGPVKMHRACWTVAKGTHAIVLQDDLLPCRNLLQALDRIAEVLPNDPVCIYDMNISSLHTISRRGDVWRRMKCDNWGGSVMLPRSWISRILAWEKYAIVPQKDDAKVLSLYAQAHDRFFYHTSQLLQHIGAHSTLHHGRVYSPSPWFVGETFDAMSIDWTRGVETAYTEHVSLSLDFFGNLTPSALEDWDFDASRWRPGSVSASLAPPRRSMIS